MLTAEERKVAAERARNYPPGFGHTYIARRLTEEEETSIDNLFNPCGSPGVSNAISAAQWLSVHPEDHAIG